jgi:hypothetical protein
MPLSGDAYVQDGNFEKLVGTVEEERNRDVSGKIDVRDWEEELRKDEMG